MEIAASILEGQRYQIHERKTEKSHLAFSWIIIPFKSLMYLEMLFLLLFVGQRIGQAAY